PRLSFPRSPWSRRSGAWLDHSADDAVARVAGRVARLVVFLGVDDDGGTVGIEQRVGLARIQRDAGERDLGRGHAVFRGGQVGQVAGVGAAVGLHAVVAAVRV